MKRILVLLILAAFGILGANTEYIPAAGSGVTAPGVVGNNATLATLKWIWGLERVPFPGAIDPPSTGGSWTDYYFSVTGGDWAVGSDSNGGLTPEDAYLTIDKARTVCFSGAYIRCNFDQGDVWDNAEGWGNLGFGLLNDAAVTPGACPSDLLGAMAQPCWWLRSSPGGRATWDATGTTQPAVCLELETVAQRAHLLIEAIDITCSSNGFSATPWDTDGNGILTVVAGDGRTDDVSGSGNIMSSHDVSISHAYGNVTMAYSGTATGTNAPIATQYGSTIAIHTSGLIAGPPSTATDTIVSISQAGGAIDASLEAEAEGIPTYVLVTGAHLQVPVESLALSPTMSFSLGDGLGGSGSGRSGNATGVFISNYFENLTSATSGGDHVSTGSTEIAGSVVNLSFIYPTFSVLPGTGSHLLHVPAFRVASDSVLNMTFAGAIVEGGQDTADQRLFRLVDNDWLNGSGGSVLRITDMLFESTGSSSWHISGSTSCLDSNPTDLETCAVAERAGSVIVSNADDVPPTSSGTATAGSIATTLENSAAGWTASEWVGSVVRMTSGTTAVQIRRITANTPTQITVSPAWKTTTPGAGDSYDITRYIQGNGYCDVEDSGDCVGHVAGVASDYSVGFSDRASIPAFIAGKRLTGFTGTPVTDNDTGRQTGNPWSEL